jgi:GT2 family glycosyltransferase
VTYNALPWLERCLASVRGHELVVVDHGSTDGTVELVHERFPEALVFINTNRGYGAGLNAGIARASGRWLLLLNSDAWAEEAAAERLLAFGDAHPRAAVVFPRARNVDGSLQRTVRGFPTIWRLATEYLFLRKLAPGSSVLNGYYAGGFDHDRPRRVEWAMGFAMFVRREAVDDVGALDESFFMFAEETDWCRRFWDAGWEVWFTPTATFTHVGGASHGGRMFPENVRSHLRFLAKHRGLGYAEAARVVLLVALVLRGLVFRGERGAQYREAARLLASGRVATLLA